MEEEEGLGASSPKGMCCCPPFPGLPLVVSIHEVSNKSNTNSLWEEEEEFFNHCKNDLKRPAHTLIPRWGNYIANVWQTRAVIGHATAAVAIT